MSSNTSPLIPEHAQPALPDLRGILAYIPRFRDRIFVFAIDGSIIARENFGNILLDLAVLRSLNIRIILVHGASEQIRAKAMQRGVALTSDDGLGVTDAASLDISVTAANRVSHELLEGLASTDLRACVTNAVIAHPFGIVKGVDHLNTGRVERIDKEYFRALLDAMIIPIVPPLGFDGEGATFRVNSDAVAARIATELGAVKLIYVTDTTGVTHEGRLVSQMSVPEAKRFVEKEGGALARGIRSKIEHGIQACGAGVSRVHILNGREDEAMLTEVFTSQGVGTMIYANEYNQIRPARRRDVSAIHNLIQQSVLNEELVPRSREEILRTVDDFFVFSVDRTIAGCVALHVEEDGQQAELACLYVSNGYENSGVGRKLLKFVEDQARAKGMTRLYALSTQAFNFFIQKGRFVEGSSDILPPERRAAYESNGRRSKVLVKDL